MGAICSRMRQDGTKSFTPLEHTPIPSILLTPANMSLLQRTWCTDFIVMDKFAALVYTEIFNEDPSLKKMFPPLAAEANLDSTDIRSNELFSKMSVRLAQTLDMLVRKMDDEAYVRQLLISTGRKHLAFEHRGFHEGHWPVGEKAIVEAMQVHRSGMSLSDSDDAMADELWRAAVHYFVQEMRTAFLNAKFEGGNRRVVN